MTNKKYHTVIKNKKTKATDLTMHTISKILSVSADKEYVVPSDVGFSSFINITLTHNFNKFFTGNCLKTMQEAYL
jgi:hypothetical protein